MNRRTFTAGMLATLSSVSLLDTLLARRAIAAPAQTLVDAWLAELQTMCRDLRTDKLTPDQWQTQIGELHAKLPLEDLLKLIDFERSIKGFDYPEHGFTHVDPVLPRVAGIESYDVIGRIFGLSKDRAIMPHGHLRMLSCQRVLAGELRLRQYDRVKDERDALVIKPAGDEIVKTGAWAATSKRRKNLHWLLALSKRAYTFDLIVLERGATSTQIDYIDIDAATTTKRGALRAKILPMSEALEKYG